jgi:hypothetical protein
MFVWRENPDAGMFSGQTDKHTARFRSKGVVLARDRGVITQALRDEELAARRDRITAFCARDIEGLAAGALQMSSSAERAMASIASPRFPAAQSVARHHPERPRSRALKREEPKKATETTSRTDSECSPAIWKRFAARRRLVSQSGRLRSFQMARYWEIT